jgi:hypothetical protein
MSRQGYQSKTKEDRREYFRTTIHGAGSTMEDKAQTIDTTDSVTQEEKDALNISPTRQPSPVLELFKERLVKRIIQKHKDRIILNTVYRRLKKKKFEIHLYYLVQEGLCVEGVPKIQPKLEPIISEFLEASDIRILASKAERDYSEEKMLKMLSEDCKCLVIKHKGEIVAYTWYNLQQCDTRLLSFQLKEDEAYIYSARTFSAYKGRSLAPYLRYELYKHLHKMGRKKFYSIISFSNIPAIMLKRKLDSKPLKLYLYIKIFNKYQINIPIKKYK